MYNFRIRKTPPPSVFVRHPSPTSSPSDNDLIATSNASSPSDNDLIATSNASSPVAPRSSGDCTHGLNCYAPDCRRKHPKGWFGGCPNGVECKVPLCLHVHRECYWGSLCNNRRCQMRHLGYPKPACRYGRGCDSLNGGDSCRYNHPPPG